MGQQTRGRVGPPLTRQFDGLGKSDWWVENANLIHPFLDGLVSLACFDTINCYVILASLVFVRDGNWAGRARVSLSHTHPRKKNQSPSAYPNLTGIKLLSHPHPHRVTGGISYPYPYSFSYYFNINFN